MMQFGRQPLVIAVHVVDGKIREVHSLLNPDKLDYLRGQLAEHSLAERSLAEVR